MAADKMPRLLATVPQQECSNCDHAENADLGWEIRQLFFADEMKKLTFCSSRRQICVGLRQGAQPGLVQLLVRVGTNYAPPITTQVQKVSCV